MATAALHELNQRYVRLTDRSRSQWTFYQFLQGLFKHLRSTACPLELDFNALFNTLREIPETLGSPDTTRAEKALTGIGTKLEDQAKKLLAVDQDIPPSLLRRFFDRLRTQDEKVLLAIIKFYLDVKEPSQDILDKLDILFTRLSEIPRGDGTSLAREKHELERIVQPLLQGRDLPRTTDQEIGILLSALSELKTEVVSCRSFTELVGGGALDRFRTLKRRLGSNFLHPKLLPQLLQTTVAIKNRFHELWEEEQASLLDDTNRVRELQRQLELQPELMTNELREAFEAFSAVHIRFDRGRQDESVRREDALELRITLNRILEQFDNSNQVIAAGRGFGNRGFENIEPATEIEDDGGAPRPDNHAMDLLSDALIQEYVNKLVFALELVGSQRSPAESAHAKELATLRLEPWEIEACQAIGNGKLPPGSLAAERAKLILQATALRIRMDEEAREIERLQRRSSEHLQDLLERATQSLHRAAEYERRFTWLIDDALYRGDTEQLEKLHRSRFRLLQSYSSLWLTHNERGGISPF
jgi:hypothetical protein